MHAKSSSEESVVQTDPACSTFCIVIKKPLRASELSWSASSEMKFRSELNINQKHIRVSDYVPRTTYIYALPPTLKAALVVFFYKCVAGIFSVTEKSRDGRHHGAVRHGQVRFNPCIAVGVTGGSASLLLLHVEKRSETNRACAKEIRGEC